MYVPGGSGALYMGRLHVDDWDPLSHMTFPDITTRKHQGHKELTMTVTQSKHEHDPYKGDMKGWILSLKNIWRKPGVVTHVYNPRYL
jgi:hypothetical protein